MLKHFQPSEIIYRSSKHLSQVSLTDLQKKLVTIIEFDINVLFNPGEPTVAFFFSFFVDDYQNEQTNNKVGKLTKKA